MRFNMTANIISRRQDTLNTKATGMIITCLCIFIYSFSGTNMLNDFLMKIYGSSTFWDTYLDPIYYTIFFLLFGFTYRKELIQNTVDLRDDGKKGIFTIGFYFLIIIVAITITSIALNILHIGISENQKAIESSFEDNMILSSIVTVGLAPFVEEMIFRFHIFNTIRGKKRRRKFAAILISSICFAFYHTTFISIFSMNFGEVMTLLPYFVIGMILACLRAKTDNLIYPVVLHMAYNLMATVAG